MKNVDLSELPPELVDTVRFSRAELAAAGEEEVARLRAALAQFKYDMEIELAVYRRLVELFEGARQPDTHAAPPIFHGRS
jgi:hypothetical protein